MNLSKLIPATLVVLMLLSCGGSDSAEGGGKITTPTPTPTPPPSIDSDGDGLTDWEESLLGTDPNKVDTDDDGLSDSQEVSRGNPKTYDSGLDTIPTDADTDNDGYLDGDDVDPLDGCSPDSSRPICSGGTICDRKPWMPSCL